MGLSFGRVALLLCLLAVGAREEVYVLGSSNSAGALPEGLDGSPAWHVSCSYPLLWQWNNPGNP